MAVPSPSGLASRPGIRTTWEPAGAEPPWFFLEVEHGGVNFPSRRSFMIGAGWAAAASVCAFGEQAGARKHASSADLSSGLKSLVRPERKFILETMASEDIPGAAVCLIYDGTSWIEALGVT